MSKGNSQKISIAKKTIKLFFSTFLIILILSNIKLIPLYDVFKKCNTTYLLLTYLLFIFGVAISTYKWMILLRAQHIHHPQFIKLAYLYLIGMFFSNFMPTETGGDIIRAYEVGKENNNQIASFSAIAAERISGLSALIVYATIGVALNFSLASSLKVTTLILSSFAIMLISYYIIFNERFYKKLVNNTSRFSRTRLFDSIKKTIHHISIYKKKKHTIIITVLTSLVFQFFTIFFVYALLLSMHISVNFINLLLICPSITIVSMLPLSINGIGLRESAFIYMFTKNGVTSEQALALALIYRIGIMVPSVIGGILYFFSNITLIQRP